MTHRQATSLRQSAEWGMRAIEGSFPRLKDKLFYRTPLKIEMFSCMLSQCYITFVLVELV
jgi:hypothetical protein